MSGLRYWYAENRGTTFAFGLFVLMFAIYLCNYPSALSTNVFQTAANKAVLLALVESGMARQEAYVLSSPPTAGAITGATSAGQVR